MFVLLSIKPIRKTKVALKIKLHFFKSSMKVVINRRKLKINKNATKSQFERGVGDRYGHYGRLQVFKFYWQALK